MAATAIGSIDLIKSLGLTFAQQNGITNIWELIPPEKQTLYRCAYQVIKAANDAFPEPTDEEKEKWGDVKGKIPMWRAGMAYKLIATIISMTEWRTGKQGRDLSPEDWALAIAQTASVVQQISDWFAKHGWEHLKEPLTVALNRARTLGRNCGWKY